MLHKKFFVTGTDTAVGKTYCTCKIIQSLVSKQQKVLGIKPIAAGSEMLDGKAVNEDAMQLMQVANVKLPYVLINPVLLKEACSPNIAANLERRSITVDETLAMLAPALATASDYTFIEGAGGWFVPLNCHETIADLAKALKFPVILIVDIKLGCINHALLTAKAIENSGLEIYGFIANQINQDVKFVAEQIAIIKEHTGMSCYRPEEVF